MASSDPQCWRRPTWKIQKMAASEFSRKKLIEFFKTLDSLLTAETQVTLIGGSAIILGHGIDRGTTDVDPWGKVLTALQDKWSEAVKISGIDIQLDTSAGVAQGPDGFEDRLKKLTGQKFKHLKILYPEAHDLALMKVIRNVDIDANDIDALHKK